VHTSHQLPVAELQSGSRRKRGAQSRGNHRYRRMPSNDRMQRKARESWSAAADPGVGPTARMYG
jgi:hypothetical protein